MRSLIAVVCAAGIAVASSALAWANAPERTPFPPVDVTIPAGVLCPFPLHVEDLVIKEVQKTFVSGNARPFDQLVTGRLVEQYTNVDTGATIALQISGPGKFTNLPGGGTKLVRLGISSFPLFPGQPGGPAGLVTSGPVTQVFDANGDLLSITIGGHVSQNICVTLAS